MTSRFGAAMIVTALPATVFAQNTLPEIHLFMTSVSCTYLNGGMPPLNSYDHFYVPRFVGGGGPACFAVWMQALPGDSGFTAITNYAYEIAASGTPAHLSRLSVIGRRQRDLGGSYMPYTPVAGNSAVLYNDGTPNPLSPTVKQFFGVSGGASLAGAGAEVNSNSAGDHFGAFMIQVVGFSLNHQPGDIEDLRIYLTTPRSGGNGLMTQGSAGSLYTVAFGPTLTGAYDQKRISNPTADLIGTINDRLSTTEDARILGVPEPASAGLLILFAGWSIRRRNRRSIIPAARNDETRTACAQSESAGASPH